MQWHGQKRSNDTHASTTDPDARLYRKSNNTAAQLTAATGYAECNCETEMLKRLPKSTQRRTVRRPDHPPQSPNFITLLVHFAV